MQNKILKNLYIFKITQNLYQSVFKAKNIDN